MRNEPRHHLLHLKSFIVFLGLSVLFLIVLNTVSNASGDPNAHGVLITAETISERSGDPGDMVSYDLTITNSGDVNDSFEIILSDGGDALPGAMNWSYIRGLIGTSTGMIRPGEWTYLDLTIEIPEFSREKDGALAGLYDLRVTARSNSNGSVTDEKTFEFEVERASGVSIAPSGPHQEGLINTKGPIEMQFDLDVENLGNVADDLMMTVPDNEFTGDRTDWTALFGIQTSETLSLDPLENGTVQLTVIIDKNTGPGNYSLRVKAEALGDTSTYAYTTIFFDLRAAEYGMELEWFANYHHRCVPSEESEKEFRFSLTNTGELEDSFTIKVETPLMYGVFKGWTMEFEDKTNTRVDQILVPSDLKGSTDLSIQRNSRVDITLYVSVSNDEDEGFYEGIEISATSNSDFFKTESLFFNLTVILPNIRVTDKGSEFFIEPASGIEEDDSVDIRVRIYNDGSTDTKEFWVFFYNGKDDSPRDIAGNYIALERVENIPMGQYIDVNATWDEIPGGENDIFVYADKPVKSGDGKTMIRNVFSDDGLVLESKEDDNTASISGEIQDAIDLRPDLTITHIDFDDKERDTTTTVTVTIANVGTAKALQGSAQISLKIGGTSIKDKRTNAINPFLPEEIDINDDIDIEFRWEVPEDDEDLSVKVIVDHPDDSNSKNDRYSSGIRTDAHSSEQSNTTIFFFGIAVLFIISVIITGFLIFRSRGIIDPPIHQAWKPVPRSPHMSSSPSNSDHSDDRPREPDPSAEPMRSSPEADLEMRLRDALARKGFVPPNSKASQATAPPPTEEKPNLHK